MQLFVSALEMIGTVAFAASGALTAMRKKMDLLGVIVLGVVTAVGGGMIRDILLGILPPLAFRNPLAVIVAIAVSVILFIPWVRHHLMHNQRLFETVLLVMRDILAGNTPYIFVKHVYACASLLGATVCALLWRVVPNYVAMLTGMLCVLILRLLSAYFRWNLPHTDDKI